MTATVTTLPTQHGQKPPPGRPHRLVDLAVDGITYRQLDYWARRGFLGDQLVDGPGSGKWRWLTDGEQRLTVVLCDLVRAGFPAELAATVAPHLVAGGTAHVGRFTLHAPPPVEG